MRVTEIFFSLQGEGTRTGLPCAFVRFTGCDLRCVYCDTAYAFHGGTDRTRDEILAEVARFPTRLVLLTGGEPMLQTELPALAGELLARGYEVLIETHGQRPLDALPAEVVRIVDVKTPDSGEVATDLAYLDRLAPALERVGGVAVDAAQVAPGEPDERARPPRARPLPLDAEEDLRHPHRRGSLTENPGAGTAATRTAGAARPPRRRWPARRRRTFAAGAARP